MMSLARGSRAAGVEEGAGAGVAGGEEDAEEGLGLVQARLDGVDVPLGRAALARGAEEGACCWGGGGGAG